MPISEEQLKIWSHQGAITTAKATADSVKNALSNYEFLPDGIKFEVYLQGSYKNDTNIRGDSDVDIIAQLNPIFYSNLSKNEKEYLGIKSASYHWNDFRVDVLNTLKQYYGSANIKEGNKSLKIKANNGRLPADVVVCAEYRKYNSLNLYDYISGMIFWSQNENREIINYPKIHYENGKQKHQNTANWYKPIVRMFKNIRSYLVEQGEIEEQLAPSYFLECLLYNLPNDKFGVNYQETFYDIVNWLNNASLDNSICQNEQLDLFGLTPEQWLKDDAESFIQALIDFWNQ